MKKITHLFLIGLFAILCLQLSAQTTTERIKTTKALYETFKNPDSYYRPFVRWWWNGNRIDSVELVRELHLLKEAGIGGVEINPIVFPPYADDMDIPELPWLSDEWIDMLRVTFNEADKLGMTCDLIVGSGWPFGGEFLPDSLQSQILMNYTFNVTGPYDLVLNKMVIFSEADPHISSPYLGRSYELKSLELIPVPCEDFSNTIDLMPYEKDGVFHYQIPKGKYTVAAQVLITGFMKVMMGAPGARGPVIDHYNREAVKNYFDRMSSTIEKRLGKKLSNYLRAMFIDSFELEGTNWNKDFKADFQKRYGYDIEPYIPFFLYKSTKKGEVVSFNPPVEVAEGLKDTVERVRFDFEQFKAEKLLLFLNDYTDWCHKIGVKSRAQSYGHNFFPLESSMMVDFPECESWTMTWTRHKLGLEMSEQDYRKGRAYTMVNKYVSSAAHLADKPHISCEEMTNTYTVFNMTMQDLKIGGDQTAISGVTHSIFHGFNYSPEKAEFPGWIQYGAYYSERNNWWPFFHLYNEYKARLSSVLQNVTYKADIAILNPIGDMWSTIGMQNEPFPAYTIHQWKTFIWEAMSKCGSSTDYVTENIINKASIQNGKLTYGKCQYSLLTLINVERMTPKTAQKVLQFAKEGGRVLCIDTVPYKSLGMYVDKDMNNVVADSIVKDCFEQMMKMDSTRFILVHKPDSNFLPWYDDVMRHYQLPHYMDVKNPDLYVMQNHYVAENGSDFFFFSNAHRYNRHETDITFPAEMLKNKMPYIWNLETGERHKLVLENGNTMHLDLGPAQSLMLVFDREKPKADTYVDQRKPFDQANSVDISHDWKVEFRHSLLDSVWTADMEVLQDLDSIEEYKHFTGTAVYRKTVNINKKDRVYIDLGVVEGVAKLIVNGHVCDTTWYGLRQYDITDYVNNGSNDIEVQVTTTMGNYLKTLKDLKAVQRWVNNRNPQWYQAMGLVGPCKLFY